MRVLELADRLRARGLNVVEVAGWQTRGREFPSRPDICIRHWTAGPATGSTPSLGVVTNGRADLPGPLCQIYQSREVDGNDRIFVIASGVANHAGKGSWAGVSGNSASMGLEIEWSGPNEAFSAQRKEISEQAMAALMQCAKGTNTDDACEHREYAGPRKIDTNLDGNELRRRMRELLGPGATPATPVVPSQGGAPAHEHIVLPGETLSRIARESGVSLDRILDLNPQFAANPGLIKPGQKVRVG
jgi:LysM repeat protein